MNNIYYTVNQPDGSTLCLAPLTGRRIASSDVEIDDPSGIFLYEHSGPYEAGSVRIIAKVMSEDAVLMFRSLFEMS